MMHNPYQQYRSMQAETADGGQLVVMLYEGAIRFLHKALANLEEHNRAAAHDGFMRTQEIIEELMSTLDLNAGEIAANLYQIYEYMHFRVVEANVKKDAAPATEVLNLLHELLPAWQEVARQSRCRRQSAPRTTNLAIALV